MVHLDGYTIKIPMEDKFKDDGVKRWEKITVEQLLKAGFKVMEPTEQHKKGELYTIYVDPYLSDGGGTMIAYRWTEDRKAWELLNAVVVPPATGKITMYCAKKCKCTTDHIINKDANKIKCLKCNEVTQVKI